MCKFCTVTGIWGRTAIGKNLGIKIYGIMLSLDGWHCDFFRDHFLHARGFFARDLVGKFFPRSFFFPLRQNRRSYSTNAFRVCQLLPSAVKCNCSSHTTPFINHQCYSLTVLVNIWDAKQVKSNYKSKYRFFFKTYIFFRCCTIKDSLSRNFFSACLFSAKIIILASKTSNIHK